MHIENVSIPDFATLPIFVSIDEVNISFLWYNLFMNYLISIATIFLGSFLSFALQPMIGKTLLPVFGGTASVWTACLCSFQLLLLLGYFYAHYITRKKKFLVIHLVMLFFTADWIFFSALNF